LREAAITVGAPTIVAWRRRAAVASAWAAIPCPRRTITHHASMRRSGTRATLRWAIAHAARRVLRRRVAGPVRTRTLRRVSAIRSVALRFPGATIAGRARLLFPLGLFAERLPFGMAEGGRFCESSCCRAVIPELAREFADALLPGRFSNWPLTRILLRAPELPAWPFARALIAPFIARTDSREAARAGAVRAMTARF